MDRKYAKLFAGAAAVALAVSSVGSAVAQDESAARRVRRRRWLRIGVSNTSQGNGWREEMHLLDPGAGARVRRGRRRSTSPTATRTRPVSSRTIRNLIAAGVDAIIVNPADPDALELAPSRRPPTPASSSSPSMPGGHRAVRLHRSPTTRRPTAYLGAKWLFEQLGGKGDVVYMRGLRRPLRPTTTATWASRRAWQEYPDINIAKEVFTGWQQRRRQAADARHDRQRHPASTASGPPASTTSSSTPGRGRRPVVPDRRCRQRRVREPATSGTRSRASRAPRHEPGSVGGAASRWRSRSSTASSPSSRPTRSPRWSRHPGPLGERDREGKAAMCRRRLDPDLDPTVAGRHHDPRLDHLHQGPDSSPARVPASSPNPGS